jgi:hypothetical protein
VAVSLDISIIYARLNKVRRELRSFAIDYLQSANAIVIERGRAELLLDMSASSETVNTVQGRSQKAIVEVELKRLHRDGSREILRAGRGEAVREGQSSLRAIELAGQQALLDLQNYPRLATMAREQPFNDRNPGRYAFNVSQEIRNRITQKAVVLAVPRDVRAVALDYVRDAGGVVVEGSRAPSWKLTAKTRKERVMEGAMREKVVIEVELAHQGGDRSWKVVMRGQGEEFYQRHDWSQAVSAAARQALDRLSP